LAFEHMRDRQVHAVGWRPIYRIHVRANRINPQRTTECEGMTDGTRLLNWGDHRHIAERRERTGQRLNPLRVHTIVVGYKNSRHENRSILSGVRGRDPLMQMWQANNEQEHRSRSRQRLAHDESRRGTHTIVHDTERDARDEHADAEYAVVKAE